MKKYDVIVVGSGPIAVTTTLLLAKSNVKVALLVDKPFLNCEVKNDGPARLFAIAQNSYNLFSEIGLSEKIPTAGQAINHIRVVDENSYSKVDFSPETINFENFGYMIDEFDLLKFLYERLHENLESIDLYHTSNSLKIDHREFFVYLSCESFEAVSSSKNENLTCLYTPLVVGADGKYSRIRSLAGIDTREFDYDETAIVVDISHPDWPHNGIAVEKFTPNGAFAILPKHEGGGTTSSLVWVEQGKITKDDLNFLDKGNLRSLITRKLNSYLGEINLSSEPLTYSLKLVQAKERFRNRIVLVGDASQAIHPVAGQGVNLGLRDVQGVVKMISEGLNLGLDIGSELLLKDYSDSRDFDVKKMIGSTTFIVKLFTNDIIPIKILRRIGLQAFDKIDCIKKIAMHYASGF